MQIKRWHLSSSTQNSTVLDESKSSLLLFDIVSTTFIPGKISSEKKVSKLRSIAELRAFYGILSMLSVVLHLPIGVAVVAAQCIAPADALHTTWSHPPPPVTHCINTYLCTDSHRERGGGGSTKKKVRESQ
jgi:hypothetical protein